MSLSDLLANHEWGKAISLCEEEEQRNAAEGRSHEHAPEHVLALLLQGQLFEAEYVSKRLDDQAIQRTAHIFTLTQKLRTGDREGFFKCAQLTKWATDVEQSMVKELVNYQRQIAIRLIGHTYSTVAVSTVARLVGVSLDEVADVARANGWLLEEDGFVAIPQQQQMPTSEATAPENSAATGEPSNQYGELKRLTEHVVQLQTT